MNKYLLARQLKPLISKTLSDPTKQKTLFDEWYESYKDTFDFSSVFEKSEERSRNHPRTIENKYSYMLKDFVDLLSRSDNPIVSEINQLQQSIQNLQDMCLSYCQDTNNSLDERWALYVDSGTGSDSNDPNWYLLDKKLSTGDNVNDFFQGENTNRGSVVDIVYRINNLEDDFYKGWADDWVTEEIIITLKEFVMKNGYRSYTYDW